jgi:uncharacterized protein YlxW (UPF0749 family)
MRRRSSQVTIAIVTFILGFLAYKQFQVQATSNTFAGLSTQDLTVLVANLNDRNDQLRSEISTLERELEVFGQNEQRGDASVDEVRADLRRVRLYAGVDAATGPGVSILVHGPIDGTGIQDLINELRNAGAEAMAIDDIRIVPGVVSTGAAGEVMLDGAPLADPFTIQAIGAPDKLTGSLTRSGGIIAQLAATQPKVGVDVTPLDHITVPSSERELVPSHGHPRL